MLDRIVDFLARYPSIPVLVGMVLIVINLVFQFFPGLGWLRESNLFLHLGVLLSLAGILLSNAL